MIMPNTRRPWHEDSRWLRVIAFASGLLCLAGMAGALGTLIETDFGTRDASLSALTWAVLVAGIGLGVVASSLMARNRRRTAEGGRHGHEGGGTIGD